MVYGTLYDVKVEYDYLFRFYYCRRDQICRRLFPCLSVFFRNGVFTYMWMCGTNCPAVSLIEKLFKENKIQYLSCRLDVWSGLYKYRLSRRRREQQKFRHFLQQVYLTGVFSMVEDEEKFLTELLDILRLKVEVLWKNTRKIWYVGKTRCGYVIIPVWLAHHKHWAIRNKDIYEFFEKQPSLYEGTRKRLLIYVPKSAPPTIVVKFVLKNGSAKTKTYRVRRGTVSVHYPQNLEKIVVEDCLAKVSPYTYLQRIARLTIPNKILREMGYPKHVEILAVRPVENYINKVDEK